VVDFMPDFYGKVFILSQFELARLREDKVCDWLVFKRCVCALSALLQNNLEMRLEKQQQVV
jgi:hypothetical protein